MSRLLRIVGCAGLLSAVVILGATFVVPLAAGASTQRGSTRLIDTNRVVGFPRQTVLSTGEQARPGSLSGRGKAVAPKITLQPASDTVSVGSTASFSAAASGSPTPTVRWKDSTNGSTWSTIRGATSATYSFTASSSQNGYEYEAVFTNSAGTATTTAATLTVTANAIATITFNSEGGVAVAPVTDPVGTQITLPSDTYAGHTFDGWFLAASGGTALTSPYTITATTTLYAQWTANASDTITFNSEGGVAVAPVTDPVGTEITLPSDTYAGYTFDGWFVAASGGTALTSPYTLTGSVVLYAQWTANISYLESSNWSGYANSGATFNAASASWTVPTVNCQSGTDAYSAQWIGIDGYTSSTVEQDGTEADCIGGSASYDAWYEMYGDSAVNNGYEVELSPTTNPVDAGDSMSASVSFSASTGEWTLTIDDSTRWSAAYSTTISFATPARSSAEWVVERPEICVRTCSLTSLADFGSVSFSNASTTTTNSSGSISANPYAAIEMVAAGYSSTVLAVPGALDSTGEDFTDTWEAS